MESFAQRVAQPLLLQAPLEAILLDLFRQCTAQGSAVSELQAAAAAAAASSADTVARLEARLAAAEGERRGLAARLGAVEARLAGAHNLAGRAAAIDDIASMLGVDVPELVPPHVDAAAEQLAGQAAAGAASAPALGLADSFHRAQSSEGARSGGGSSGAVPPAALEAQAAHVAPASMEEAEAPGEVQGGAEAGARSPDSGAQQQQHAELAGEERGGQGERSGGATPLAVRRSSTGAAGSSPASPASSGRASPQQPYGTGTSRGATPLPEHAAVPQSPARPGSRLAGGTAPQAAEHAAGGDAGGDDAVVAAAAQRVPAIEAFAATANGGADPHAAALPAISPQPAALNAHTTSTSNAAAAAGPGAPAPALSGAAAPAPKPAPMARLEVPSPAALYAAMHASKADQPAGSAAAMRPSRVAPAVAPAQHGSAAQLDGGGAGGAAATAARRPSPEPEQTDGAEDAAGGARPKSAAACRLAEVVRLLRKRPSLKESGLLWKLQHSLAESVAEQERLRGEVHALEERLAEVQGAAGEGLERCNRRIDGVQEGLAEAVAAAAAASAAPGGVDAAELRSAAVSARAMTPRASAEELKALQERVESSAAGLAELSGQVAASAERLARLEAGAAAATLVRASSSGSVGDMQAALQGHLLAQQQKLQAQVEALVAGIRQALPGQVHDSVTGAVVEVGKALERRLAERLATRQDLQLLSIKVGSKASREEVERMLRAHRGPQPGTAEPGAGPAAGVTFKCISCDTALQPVVFAASPGGLSYPQSLQAAAHAGVADLRYSQLPAASPPRAPGQPWESATVGAASPQLPPASVGSETSRLSSLSSGGGGGSGGGAAQAVQLQAPQAAPLTARPSTSRLGAPVGWMHRMRRETGSGADAASPGSRRDSQQEPQLLHQPSVTAVGLGRPHTAAPMATPRPRTTHLSQQQSGGSGEGVGQGGHEEGATEFYEAIREEPQMAAGTGDGGGLAAGEQPHGKGTLPALPQSPGGRIKAARPATALPGAVAALPSAGDEAPRGSTSGKRRSVY